MLTGTAITTATSDTTSVPNANASVPNVPDWGSQTSPVKYERPCERNAGQAFTTMVTAMSARITRTIAPATNVTPRKARSNVRPGGRTVLSGRDSMAAVMRRKGWSMGGAGGAARAAHLGVLGPDLGDLGLGLRQEIRRQRCEVHGGGQVLAGAV